MSISERFIRRPVSTVVLTASAVLFGVLAYWQLPVNDLPVVDYPVIQVTVAYPGANPATVAANIATPLERQFMQIPGLELVTSTSSQGYCSMTLQFSLSKGIDAAATDVQAAITRSTGSLPLDLPSPPTFTKTNPNDQPVVYMALASDSLTDGQLYELASTDVGQRISILNGVSQVSVYGSKRAIRVQADPSALASRGLTMEDLAAAIRRGTTYQGAGQFDGPYRSFLLEPQGQLDTAADYQQLIIASPGGKPVYLRDVARVIDSVEDERMERHFWVRGLATPSANVMVAVSRQAGSNAVEVAQAVKDLLPSISAQLPASVTLRMVNDRSRSIVESVDDVKETLVIAFFLVVIVIYVFLGRATDTLIPVVAMPLSLLLVLIVMRVLDFSLNNISLMALMLAVGFLVDDAIVFLENTVRRMERFNESPMIAAINSAKEISFTILSMTLSLASVFLPLVFMSGLVGRIFHEFAVTIISAIIASGVVSLTLTPLMCARSLSKRGPDTKETLMERIFGAFEKRILAAYSYVLWFFLRHRWISVCIWLVCLGGTIHLLRIIPKAFLPIGDSSVVRGIMIAQEGTSPRRLRELQTETEKVLHSHDAVMTAFSMTGNKRFLAMNQGHLLAFLKPPSERAPIKQVTEELMRNIAASVDGVVASLQPNPVLRIATGATTNRAGQFAYTLSGINPPEVYEAANNLVAALMEQRGRLFSTIISDLYARTPQLKINIRREQASNYGVSATRIESLLRNAYSQNYVYLIKRSENQYQVILETTEDTREHPEDLGQLYITSDDGQRLIPLDAVATWEASLGMQSVNHLNQFTSVTINFNLLPGVPIGDAVNFIEDTARRIVPANIRSDFQGEALTFRDTIRSLTILMVLAVFVMYVILAILYESYVHPLTVLSTLPPAMVGGLLTLHVFGAEASLYAFIGLFMLMGIVKKNGIMIVDFAIQHVARGHTAEQAIHDASVDRFRPIVMTTLAAVMGALPIALAWGAGGGSRQPLGLVIVGGLLVSQLLTLFVTPVIYLYLELFQEKVLNRIPFFTAHYEGHQHAEMAP